VGSAQFAQFVGRAANLNDLIGFNAQLLYMFSATLAVLAAAAPGKWPLGQNRGATSVLPQEAAGQTTQRELFQPLIDISGHIRYKL
jgi:hypothetical protein